MLWVMPDGRLRPLIEDRFEQFNAVALQSWIPPLDKHAARAYGEIRGNRKALGGHPMSISTVRSRQSLKTRGFPITTRNVEDFYDCGLELINPFSVVG